MLGGAEVFISAIGLVGAYLLFTGKFGGFGKKGLVDGLDPDFKGGAKINATAPVDTHDGFKPSCQVFDPFSQLFENAGNPDWDKSTEACFSAIDQSRIPRYVDVKGGITFKVEDPLKQPDAEAGTCYFDDGTGKLFAHLNFGGLTPVNRSQRLCFSAGQSYEDAGHLFVRTSDKKAFTNPNIPWDYIHKTWMAGNDYYNATTDGSTLAIMPETTDQCQVQKKLVSPSHPEIQTIEAWVRTNDSAQHDGNVQDCIQKGGRFWDHTTGEIVYWNSNDSKPVSTPMYSSR